MIRREIRKSNFDRGRVFIGEEQTPTGNADDVISVEILRGGSTYDPEMINAVVATYADGSMEVTSIIRGINPPVPNTVPDYAYINNALISGFTVEVTSTYGNRKITGEIVRENGYGKIRKLNLTYIN